MRVVTHRSGERKKPVKWQKSIGLLAAACLFVALSASTPATAHLDANASKLQTVATQSQIVTRAPDVAPSKNAILNMFQWTWNSIATECTDVIGPAGFGYVQVSPPQEHIIGDMGANGSPWWTSYQPVSYKLESKLGTAEEFAAMVNTCKAANVSIIADAVINHMTGQTTPGTGWGGTPYSLENYPGPEGQYTSEHFHDCKTDIANYGDREEVQNCRLVALQDLDTGSAYVQQEIADYLDKLANIGVAGFRIDAAKHMDATELEQIKSRTTSAQEKFWIHEVIGSGGEPIQPTEYLGSGDSHEFNYARTLKASFNGKISNLQKLGINQDLLEGYRAGVFVDNHDTERNQETLSHHAGNKYLQANVFLFSYPYGSPSAYTGYEFANDGIAREFGAPQSPSGEVLDVDCAANAFTCIHRQPEISNMVGFYNDVRATELNNWQNFENGNVVGYGRGEQGFVALNNTEQESKQTFRTFLPQGTYCNIVASNELENCAQTYTVDAAGQVDITVPAGKSVVLWTSHSTKTGAPVYDEGETTVYFHKYSSWADVNMHYGVAEAWTTPPGASMKDTCDGWYSITVPSNGSFEAVFNYQGDWNKQLHGGNYRLSGDKIAVTHGSAINIDPCAASALTKVVVYYKANPAWANHNVHYGYGTKGWTTPPGELMSPTCEGWLRKTITTDGSELELVFNNGNGEWDNPIGGGNYRSDATVIAIDNKTMTFGAPCAPEDELPEENPEPVEPEGLEIDQVKVFYRAPHAWTVPYIHFGRGDNWTSAPGLPMTEACEGWYTYTINEVLGLTSVSAVFNNVGSDWDNNNDLNYKFTTEIVAIENGNTTFADPCFEEPGSGEPGTETPSPSEPGSEQPGTETPLPTEPIPNEPSNGLPIAAGPDDGDAQVLGDSEETDDDQDNPNSTSKGDLADTGSVVSVLIAVLSVLLLVTGVMTLIIVRIKQNNQAKA